MKYITAILLILPFALFAQGQADTTKPKRFAIGVSFSPDYAFTNFTANESEVNPIYYNNRKNKDFPKMGFTAGMNFDFNIWRRLAIRTGIYYTDRGYNGRGTLTSYDNLKYEYIKIPLLFKYFIKKATLSIYILGGISLNSGVMYKHVSVAKNGFLKRSKYILDKCRNCVDTNYDAIVSIGFSYKFFKSLYLQFEPGFSYALRPLSDNKKYDYLYSINFSVGIMHKF